MPSLSVVLATYNRCPILERTLDALDRQTRRDFRAVIVDDGSSNDTWEWLEDRADEAREPQLEILHQENRGQGQARNNALRQVRDGLVFFLGDDVVPHDDFVAEHLAAHDGEEPHAVVGFTGNALLTPPQPPPWFLVGRHLVPPLVPLLSAADRRRLPLTTGLLHRVLMCAYQLGQEEARPGAEM